MRIIAIPLSLGSLVFSLSSFAQTPTTVYECNVYPAKNIRLEIRDHKGDKSQTIFMDATLEVKGQDPQDFVVLEKKTEQPKQDETLLIVKWYAEGFELTGYFDKFFPSRSFKGVLSLPNNPPVQMNCIF